MCSENAVGGVLWVRHRLYGHNEDNPIYLRCMTDDIERLLITLWGGVSDDIDWVIARPHGG